MKIYEIKDKKYSYAYLFTNDNYTDYYIEINELVDEQVLFFSMFLSKNKLSINHDWAVRWVEERVIPSSRQNIYSILKDANMSSYNELLLFIKAHGKSSMDNTELKQIKEVDLPENIKNRRSNMIIDYIFDNNLLFAFFRDNSCKLYKINNNELNIIDTEPHLSIFGNEIIFNSKVRYDYDYLLNNGEDIPLKYSTIMKFVNNSLVSNSEASNILNSSRQYLSKLVHDNRINNENGMYLKNQLLLFKGSDK